MRDHVQNLIKRANGHFKRGSYLEALRLYEEAKSTYPEISHLLSTNIILCRKKMIGSNAPKIYVCLTTISERLDKIQAVIESLHNQELLPYQIRLYVSDAPYLLDKGIDRNDLRILKLQKFPLLKIEWTENIGPYRKIIPFLQSHFDQGLAQDKIFITVDDDTIYPDYFIKALYCEYSNADAVIAFRGRFITLRKGEINSYTEWELGRKYLSMNNLPTGKDGVIYNTKFFTREFIDVGLATSLAPTADDLWIKWHTGLNGVGAIILNPEAATSDYKSFPVVDYSAEYRDVSLFKAHNSNCSNGKNDASVKELERYFLRSYGYSLSSLCPSEEIS